jgi:hypothetical protein
VGIRSSPKYNRELAKYGEAGFFGSLICIQNGGVIHLDSRKKLGNFFAFGSRGVILFENLLHGALPNGPKALFP